MTGRYVPGNRFDLLNGVVPSTLPPVSVVVVHYEQDRQLARTLQALHRQDYPAELVEIIVVDDGSARAPVVPPGVRLIRQEDRGFRAAEARNRGAAAAGGEVLCFLDADTVPEPGYLRALTRLPALVEDAVTVGRRLHADLQAADPALPVEVAGPRHRLPDPAWLADGYRATADLLHADDRSYRYIISAVLACNRRFFAQVGGFDETFREYGGEDWEWAYRAWLAGAVFAHVPAAVAWHDGPDWSGRARDDEAAARQQNREALRLAALIPVPGSRGTGLRWHLPDVVVELRSAPSATATLICIDSVLQALPDAVMLVPDEHIRSLPPDDRLVAASAHAETSARSARARVRVVLHRAVLADPAELRTWFGRLIQDQLHTVELADDTGQILATLISRRAAARAARRPGQEPSGSIRSVAKGFRVLPEEPSLAGYFGGW